MTITFCLVSFFCLLSASISFFNSAYCLAIIYCYLLDYYFSCVRWVTYFSLSHDYYFFELSSCFSWAFSSYFLVSYYFICSNSRFSFSISYPYFFYYSRARWALISKVPEPKGLLPVILRRRCLSLK
jgi:hypothetical protein